MISETSANGNGMPGGLDDHIYNRLLKERIIFLGSDVRDDNANAISERTGTHSGFVRSAR